MRETEKNKAQNDIGRLAAELPQKRKSLLTPKEISVVSGLIYAALIAGLTLLMNLIPAPNEDSTLWAMMAGFYILMVLISVFLEKFLIHKLQVKRTLFYVTAQLVILIVIIVLIVLGVQKSNGEYYNSTELSYAMAFVFSEIILLLYHLFRVIILSILHSSEKDSASGRKGNKAGKKRR